MKSSVAAIANHQLIFCCGSLADRAKLAFIAKP